jgi:uncharacterized protein YijF (DUF1287 family)
MTTTTRLLYLFQSALLSAFLLAVATRANAAVTKMVIHNIGHGAVEEDVLFEFRILGHYRPQLERR